MKTLHKIRTHGIPYELISNEYFLANLWAVQQIHSDPKEVRITSKIKITRIDYAVMSPIQYIAYNQAWHGWWWEPERLEVWDRVGRPMPKLNIPYGPFNSINY